MNIKPYISIARIDNWTKNLVMLLGLGLAYMLAEPGVSGEYMFVVYVFLSLCFASSANYVLNETIDAKSDRSHPIKKQRASVKYDLDKRMVVAEYFMLVSAALFMAMQVHINAAYCIGFYIVAAWFYNIPPLRFKDKAYADVLLESANYPIRIVLGWLCVLPEALPPSSILMLGLAGGGFAMSLKRLAELQLFASREQAVAYRKSYAVYSLHSLSVSAFVYGLFTVFGMTILALKYKTEMVLVVPVLVVWMAWYFLMGLGQRLEVIYPERLLKNKMFLLLTLLLFSATIMLGNITIPSIKLLNEPLMYKISGE